MARKVSVCDVVFDVLAVVSMAALNLDYWSVVSKGFGSRR